MAKHTGITSLEGRQNDDGLWRLWIEVGEGKTFLSIPLECGPDATVSEILQEIVDATRSTKSAYENMFPAIRVLPDHWQPE